MANRNFHQFKGSLDRGMVHVQGVISIAAGGAVSSEDMVGASVTKTDTGAYSIVLEDTYQSAKAVEMHIESAVDVDMRTQVKSVDVVSAKTIAFKTLVGAVPTDSVAACKIHVFIALKNSSVY
jgi:hypothetical protein